MITRELKLKPTNKQKQLLNQWLWNLAGVYNWAVRKIELNAKDKIYFSTFDFQNILKDHGKKLGIPSHTIQGILKQAHLAWVNYFKKIYRKPKLKSIRNKLNSIPFPDPIPDHRLVSNTIKIPGLEKVNYHKQRLPKGKIKNGRIVKRASGWYLQLTIDANNKFPVKITTKKVGIDTGFKHLVVLSDGTKFENSRFYSKSQKRLAQAQRGKNKKLTARLHEKIRNQRKDYNHKISRKIVENYSEIYITKDNLQGQAKKFGKSIGDAGISQLRNFISYKGDNHNRIVKFVDSAFTTMTCSNCWNKTGPTGLNRLAVRDWECCVCGTHHDRDVNAAMVVLNLGLGWSLDFPKSLGGV